MKIALGIILVCLLFPAIAIAEQDILQKEIDALLTAIQNADCIFIRNNTEHRSDEAVAHIKRKYDYFKNQIATAEQFIELCASQSTITKKPYKITCKDGKSMESRQWLLIELRRFRNEVYKMTVHIRKEEPADAQ